MYDNEDYHNMECKEVVYTEDHWTATFTCGNQTVAFTAPLASSYPNIMPGKVYNLLLRWDEQKDQQGERNDG